MTPEEKLGQLNLLSAELRLTLDDVAFYGVDMRRRAEAGTIRVFVGPSSTEGLETTFEAAP
jgi:beta-glucosidase